MDGKPPVQVDEGGCATTGCAWAWVVFMVVAVIWFVVVLVGVIGAIIGPT